MKLKNLMNLIFGTNYMTPDELYNFIEKLKNIGASSVEIKSKKNRIFVNFLMTNENNKHIMTTEEYIEQSGGDLRLLDDPVGYISELETLPTDKVKDEKRY